MPSANERQQPKANRSGSLMQQVDLNADDSCRASTQVRCKAFGRVSHQQT